jgi:hypothetical protein
MGQLGRYTTYVGGAATAAHTLLSEVFPADKTNYPTVAALQVAMAGGNEVAAQKVIQTNATANVAAGVGGLQPANGQQQGDLGMFPVGVNLAFGGAPDVSKVKWTNPGDPANGYIPDVTSPTAGPGHTLGTDKTADPSGTITQITAESMAGDGFGEDPKGEDLLNPLAEGPAIVSNNVIGNVQVPGKSGG